MAERFDEVRLSHGDETGHGMRERHSSSVVPVPSRPKSRRSLRSENTEESYSSNNQFQGLYVEGKRSRKRTTSNSSETEELCRNQNTSHGTQMTESSSEEDEEMQSLYPPCSQNRSRTISPERNVYSTKFKRNTESPGIEQNSSFSYFFIVIIIVIVIGLLMSSQSKNEVQTQSISDPTLVLSESIESIKATFHNQDSDIWNDISSAINEVISRTPKIPSIILLFAKETATMDCLATKLANASSTILHADKYLVFNPEDFGNDAGEIITVLKKHSPEKKKVVIIHDILNINTEAIKALHNLCDRINPLVAEAIYILTMQTNNYQSSQKKLTFVENQIYDKLSKSIDRDILMALVTRITDGAIISVQSEPRLRYC